MVQSIYLFWRKFYGYSALPAVLVGLSACTSPSRTSSDTSEVSVEQGPISIELRLAQDSASADHFAALVPGVLDSIYVSNRVDLSLVQIDSIQPNVIESGLALNVWFNVEGRERLAQVTGGNIGRRLAVRIGTQIVSAPLIVQQLSVAGRPVTVMYPLSKDSAELFVHRLKYPQ